LTKATTYTIPAHIDTDPAANLAMFLLENTGSIFGKWSGRMPAKDQRKIFGRFMGKGLLHINGECETIKMSVSVCFGLDWDVRESIIWAELAPVTPQAIRVGASAKSRKNGNGSLQLLGQGEKAAMKGLTVDANPYPAGSDDAAVWLDGYQDY
jgi:hypothetical protein